MSPVTDKGERISSTYRPMKDILFDWDIGRVRPYSFEGVLYKIEEVVSFDREGIEEIC
jgi:hypothetical protein